MKSVALLPPRQGAETHRGQQFIRNRKWVWLLQEHPNPKRLGQTESTSDRLDPRTACRDAGLGLLLRSVTLAFLLRNGL